MKSFYLKLLFVIFIITVSSTTIHAQSLTFEKRLQELENQRKQQRGGDEESPTKSNSNGEITGLEKDKGSGESTPEFSFYYVYFGKPIIKYKDEKFFGNSFSIGTKRNASTFLYGFEYNLSSFGEVKLNDLSAQLGFQTIWRHRFQPFITFNYGVAYLKDPALTEKIQGYKTSVDLGINFNPYSFIKYFSGMRVNLYNFNSKEISSMSSQELYFMVGLNF